MSMFGQSKQAGGKPLASLSSTLLARKGQAKPAMRPQGYGGFGAMTGGHDDLGWNDMGDPAEIEAPAAPAPVPPVLMQREVLHEEFAASPAVPGSAPDVTADAELEPEPAAPAALRVPLKSVSVATATRLGRETIRKRGKAAFTLRLDHDRHLRLRIASALNNASAQTLVTEALDQFLQSLPEVDALVAQIPPRAKR